jgi:hypothetical protein
MATVYDETTAQTMRALYIAGASLASIAATYATTVKIVEAQIGALGGSGVFGLPGALYGGLNT